YESDNTLSSANPPGTSRGTNVASSVTFDATGAVITIPLSAIGANVGDVIEDIYGLTYFSRLLYAVDTIPDAKSAADADESLGSYTLGGAIDSPALASAKIVVENLTTPSFRHEFANATSDDYTLNFTVEWTNATVAQTVNMTSGRANVTVLRNGVEIQSFVLMNGTTTSGAATNATANGTASPFLVTDAIGNWTVRIDYDAFVGSFGLNVTEYRASVVDISPVNLTMSPVVEDVAAAAKEEAPGLGLPLVALLLLVGVVARRRR
ncbi:MAG: hypothetical protein WC876_08905, partial [Candidatus Thermoplasmatota archaeon]